MEFKHWIHPKLECPTLFKSSDYSKKHLIQQPEIQPKQITSSNIPPATITNDELLTTIFLFEFKELSQTPLFSEAMLKKKPITAIYTNAKVDGHQVDCVVSAKIITTDGATKMPIGEINKFPFKINSLITSIKVLVIEATQYQALVNNDWLSKTNAILDWTTQELQLSQNGQHMYVPAMFWGTNNDQKKLITWEESNKEKGKEKKEETTPINIITYNSYTYTIPQQFIYH
ncbi:hypothetical protein G9A89_011460 [Geosiphon pyriformis]|nr:hypothetical protein G9A89_011460 [Geosiphon pyriformis]